MKGRATSELYIEMTAKYTYVRNSHLLISTQVQQITGVSVSVKGDCGMQCTSLLPGACDRGVEKLHAGGDTDSIEGISLVPSPRDSAISNLSSS